MDAKQAHDAFCIDKTCPYLTEMNEISKKIKLSANIIEVTTGIQDVVAVDLLVFPERKDIIAKIVDAFAAAFDHVPFLKSQEDHCKQDIDIALQKMVDFSETLYEMDQSYCIEKYTIMLFKANWIRSAELLLCKYREKKEGKIEEEG
jgi:hypothetical protein